ncbi:MAG: oligosaccharide flippase family protein [Oscillatoria sp. PMC 1051.18]|nr:oligosaccharide flippase family protein [Oscillatoria sp. PMC 1050.18]MEC5031061.1 oligosaccharide flippase family protein [Oscillatoria sp. PMC 1051.18]
MNQTPPTKIEDSIQSINLSKSSAFVLFLQSVGSILVYLAQILLVRWMGKVEYGIYEYIITWSLLLAVPINLGLPRAVVRFINEYHCKQNWGLLRGIILGSWQLIIGVSLLVCLLATGLIFLIDHYHHFSYVSVLLIGIWLIPLQGLAVLQENISIGLRKWSIAYIPTKIIYPILVITGGFLLWRSYYILSGTLMTKVTLVILGGTIAIQAGLIWLKFNLETIPALPVYVPRIWLKVSLPLLFYHTFRVVFVNTDILMLGSLIGADAVSIYSSASKTSLWVNFVLQSINIVIAPTFATLYIQDNRKQLQKVISIVTIWIFLLSNVIALVLILFAKPILGIFGTEFIEAHWALKILVIGQLISTFSGSVGNLLSMTGYQNRLMLVAGCTALINLSLNAIAIPLLGIVGAALTTSLTLSICNIWLVTIAIRNLEINPTVFSSWALLKKSDKIDREEVST